MRLKLDENLPLRARDLIRERGHDALTVLDQADAGVDDSVVAELVRRESRARMSTAS